eukprot:COSAG01_NODE_22668_length_846_cov_1.042838_1_plen_206_part_01
MMRWLAVAAVLATSVSAAPPPAPASFDDVGAWTNREGGPLQHDSLAALLPKTPPSPSPDVWMLPSQRDSSLAGEPAAFAYVYRKGFLAAGGDIATVNVSSAEEAQAACTAIIECRGVTYSGGPNGTIAGGTKAKAFLKKSAHSTGGAPWSSWVKSAPVSPPAQVINAEGVSLALRRESFTVQWLNVSGGVSSPNYSFVPPLTHGSA